MSVCTSFVTIAIIITMQWLTLLLRVHVSNLIIISWVRQGYELSKWNFKRELSSFGTQKLFMPIIFVHSYVSKNHPLHKIQAFAPNPYTP
jgi:hypothetical protein